MRKLPHHPRAKDVFEIVKAKIAVIKMDLPNRKQNRLQEFDYSQNGAYFITICVKDRKKILSDIVGDDAHIVPKKYGNMSRKNMEILLKNILVMFLKSKNM